MQRRIRKTLDRKISPSLINLALETSRRDSLSMHLAPLANLGWKACFS